MSSYWLERTSLTGDDPRAPAEGPLEEAEVVVIGAGITGLTTSLLLARAGKRVLVLEARSVGAVTTGHTTGKVSLLQGTKLSRLLQQQPEAAVRRYLEANREGQAWLLRFCDEAALGAERRTAMTYAASPEQREAADAEHRAATHLGLATRWLETPDLPFPSFGATALDEQAQIDPMAVLDELVRELTEHGGTLLEGERVVRVGSGRTPTAHTSSGLVIRADDVVIATGTPIVDRAAHFARLEAQRSYVLMFSGVASPSEMLLSAGGPTRSIREVTDEDGVSRLMVGGSGHGVGRTTSERRHLDGLRTWTAQHFPGATETHAWSAQDYRPHDGLPQVGALPFGQHRLHVATGFDKWGLTNGVAAALQLSAELLGSSMPWARQGRLPRAAGLAQAARANLEVGARMAGGWLAAELNGVTPQLPEGSGVVGRQGMDPHPVATAQVDGRRCQVSGICTHLGGVLRWNDAEHTWDCPLHGSRFAADGDVLEGPATTPLPAIDD